jgi:hypothetical protein
MAFWCPDCGGDKTLVLVNSVDLPADATHDEIALQVLECRACGLLAAATYTESRHGAAPSWRHEAVRLAEADWIRLRDALLAQQRRHGPRAGPPVDSALGSVEDGRWHPPEAIGTPTETFAVRLEQPDRTGDS